jgi:hypothetical protein
MALRYDTKTSVYIERVTPTHAIVSSGGRCYTVKLSDLEDIRGGSWDTIYVRKFAWVATEKLNS